MTREDIENMEAGRSSDNIVGLALGFLHEFELGKDNGCMVCGCVKFHSGHVDYGPRFTTDMNDAMKVSEKIKGLGKMEKYTMMPTPQKHEFHIRWSPNANIWECGFHYYECDDYQDDVIQATTAPLAICKAALLTTL
jgi:hypothetical protein